MLKRILTFYTKYFAIWVILFGVIAYCYPKPFVAVKPGMDWFFALTMFGIGIVLKVEDFERIFSNPFIVLIGSAAQFIIMPFGAFLVAKLFNLPPEIAVGLILTGAAPGAMASNVMSYIAKADTAYSVSLTTVSTLLCPILTPGLTLLLARSRLEIPFIDMLVSVIEMVIIPLFAGFAVRHFLKDKVEKILYIFPAVSSTFIIFICSLVIAINKENLANITGMVLLAGITLNIFGLLGGFGVASLFRMNIQRRRTLTIEIGMQNAGLGTVLALKHIGKQAAIPAAVFVFICIITASILAAIWQKYPTVESED
jgi:bile acid:Na+ symporter, BASS family